MAGATRRIRLATGVLIVPLRPALLLAKTAATLDVLSAGRLDLRVGLGWQREEYEATGVPWQGRGARLDDQLRACRALWATIDPVSFSSDTVSFRERRCVPKPVQSGGPPLWFGVAATERNAARIAALGAGWLPIESDRAAIFRSVTRLRDALERAGRDPAELRVRANAPIARGSDGRADLDATRAGLPALRTAGVTTAAFPLPALVRSREELPALLSRLVSSRDRAAPGSVP